MRKFFFFMIFAIVILHSYGYCNDKPTPDRSTPFVMAMIRPESDYLGKWWRLIYTEMFQRLGKKVEFRDYPSKRAAAEIDEGRADGEPGRIKEYIHSHPNLIRVDEPLFALNFTAFVTDPSISNLNSWNDLKGLSYKVSYNRGIRICEINLPKVVEADKLSSVTDPIQGIRQLSVNFIAIYVDEESGILTLLKNPGFGNKSIHMAGVLETAYVYPYIHKKNADQATRMLAVLKAMKEEERIEFYHRQVDQEFDVYRK
jgi:polar amino acid transport system substrate-binding protein